MLRKTGIGCKDAVSRLGRRHEQPRVAAKIGKAEAHSAALAYPAAAFSEEIAGTAQLKVLLGYLKAVVGPCEHRKTAPCVLRAAGRDEDAI